MFASGWAACGRRSALLAVLALFTACGSQQAAAPARAVATVGPAAEARPAAPTTAPAAVATASPAPLGLRFAYTALSTTIAPYWIAEDAGYFREEGLDLDTRFISASTVGMQSLLAR